MDGAHELKVAHTVRKGLIGEPSSNTFTHTREEVEEMTQGLSKLGTRRFEDPGTMNPEEAVGVIRSLIK